MTTATHGSDHTHHLQRLRRLEGQVRGVGRMIEERAYCVDILRQLKASRKALLALERKILEEHLDHCVKESMHKEKVQEVLQLLKESH